MSDKNEIVAAQRFLRRRARQVPKLAFIMAAKCDHAKAFKLGFDQCPFCQAQLR